MMLIEHSRHGIEIDDPQRCLQTWDDFYYAIGFIPPNYPMPAIRYATDWCERPDNSFRVVIFRIHTDDDYELPEIVKKF